MTRVGGFKYKCGWQELRPDDKKARLFAFIQPGSWCWNNAGVVGPISGHPDPLFDRFRSCMGLTASAGCVSAGGLGGGVLIDSLMDEVLTAWMVKKRDRIAGWTAKDFQALFFTHPDTDHFLGQWAVHNSVRRFGRPEVRKPRFGGPSP